MPDLRIGERGEDVIDFLSDHLGGFFDAVKELLNLLLRTVYDLLTVLTPTAMIVVLGVLALLATRRLVLTLLLTAGLLLIESMDLWQETMQSMTSVVVATAIALLVGIPLGIWSAFSPTVRAVVRPVLDLMQTLPVFVYLLPTILFFGVGDAPGLVATIVFSVPPAVRLTQLGINQVDAETVEAAQAFGASRWEVLTEVQLPLARASIMAGVNQVIMLALSMVVVAGLVGGAGLGGVVVNAVQGLQIGASIEGGLSVVVIAIYLDRVSGALGGQGRGNPSWWPHARRRPASSALPEPADTPQPVAA
ncbi:glycine betaine/proline transport system permease protein [Nocardioides thalensis]|uniref:Glycine betaine/proline transport system permease protein n=1 Tax=Nocardioides thalensis TaxID=1914755 RepID=A0A853BV65_9ACTN|nr:ABC transporter permease subunit [Nocardioides thalensis]NYI99759.1 glycine betaine/proline transport system permease protein [Nocardioides thalensis]